MGWPFSLRDFFLSGWGLRPRPSLPRPGAGPAYRTKSKGNLLVEFGEISYLFAGQSEANIAALKI